MSLAKYLAIRNAKNADNDSYYGGSSNEISPEDYTDKPPPSGSKTRPGGSLEDWDELIK